MRHLQKLAAGMATSVAYHAILRQPGLWERRKDGTSNECITLRMKTLEGNYANTFGFDMVPHLRPMIFGLMALVEGEQLCTVGVQRVAPGAKYLVAPAPEGQSYCVVLSGLPGASVNVGQESTMLLSGDAWWFDELGAELVNNSQDDLVVLLIWAVPNAPATYVPPEA